MAEHRLLVAVGQAAPDTERPPSGVLLLIDAADDHPSALLLVGQHDREVPERCAPGRRWRGAGALPGVGADVVVIITVRKARLPF